MFSFIFELCCLHTLIVLQLVRLGYVMKTYF